MTVVKTVVQKGDKAALIHLDDGSKPLWTPDYSLAVALVGKPLPPDWKIEEGQYGPKAMPPKRGGGGMSAWRNTEAGAKWEEQQRRERMEMERVSRERWQHLEEERRDRRTALMQAVGFLGPVVDTIAFEPRVREVYQAVADEFYAWLRKTSPAAGPAVGTAGAATKGSEAGREATTEQSGAKSPSPSSPAGDPTSAVTRADPDTGPGGAPPETPRDGTSTAPSGPTFPLSPSACDHKMSNGHWVRWREYEGEKVCPKCGLPQLIAMESTTADLGPA